MTPEQMAALRRALNELGTALTAWAIELPPDQQEYAGLCRGLLTCFDDLNEALAALPVTESPQRPASFEPPAPLNQARTLRPYPRHLTPITLPREQATVISERALMLSGIVYPIMEDLYGEVPEDDWHRYCRAALIASSAPYIEVGARVWLTYPDLEPA
jgi:hypothetical protein